MLFPMESMVVKGSTQIAQQAQTITKNYTNMHKLHPEDGSFPANCNGRQQKRRLLRETASYKHHTSANVEIAETVVESQERHLGSIDVGPCNLFHSKPVEEPAALQAKNTKSKVKESTENEGSVAEEEERVGSLLEECMSSFKYPEEDEGETFLREIWQIKPKDAAVCHVSLPIIQLSHHSAFKNREIHGKFNNSQISSPSTKSLLQAVSALQRRLLKDTLKDQYPIFPGDDSPCSGDSSLSERSGKKSCSPVIVGNHDDCGLLFDDDASPTDNETRLGSEVGICSPVVEANKSTDHRSVSEERLSKPPNPTLERKTNSDPSAVGNEKGNSSEESTGSLQEGNDRLLDPVITDEPDAELKGCNSQPRIQDILGYPSQLLGEDANCYSHVGDGGKDSLRGFYGGLQVEDDSLQLDQPDAGVAKYSIGNQADSGGEVLTPTCANQTTTISLENPLSKTGGDNSISVEMGFSVLDDMSQSEVNVTVQEKLSDAKTAKDNSCPPEVTVLADRHLENLHSLPDDYNEEHQIALGRPPNEGNIQEAAPPQKRHKTKSLEGSTSLAGGDTIWEDGRRKSSRRKFRPLETWRGERLLYGRIHSSLPTVIGVKYASPGENKVESCVSEEYAELVSKAALC